MIKSSNFLKLEKQDVAVVFDPVTINYLTGFYSDPHERQLFLFVYTDHEPLLFVPALEVERATTKVVDFQVVGYVDSGKPLGKIKGAIAKPDAKTIALEYDSSPDQIQWIAHRLWKNGIH